jgi:hypothetical protein
VFVRLPRSVGLSLAACVVIPLASAFSGCGQEGAGTIKIEDPNAARAKIGGGEVKSKKPLSPEAAKVKEQEQNAPNKHFQRG